MKVSALFLDYDGTIAPAEATREESAVPTPLYSTLEKISARIPVAMITAKDLGFVKPRTGFAWGWSAALGLETRLRDGSGDIAKVEGDLGALTGRVRKTLPAGIIVEEKRGSDGSLLGVSFDWSRTGEISGSQLDAAYRELSEGGYQVDRDDVNRFMDVYAAPADKGVALKTMARMLKVGPPVMYLGDTPPDNSAFEAADIAICVNHGRKDDRLRCRHSVEYDQVEGLLASLLANGLEFTMPSVSGPGATS